MFDIHTHILPGVDDGSKDFDTSLKLILSEIDNGVSSIMLTPHYCPSRGYKNNAESVKSAFADFCEKINQKQLPVKFLLGQEIYYSDYDDIIKKIENGEVLTLNNSKYVLIEFSLKDKPQNIIETVYNLDVKGYKVIIAHIERYKWMTLDFAEELKNEGCLLQMNAESYFSLKLGLFCKKLIKNNLIDFIASDLHNGRKNYLKKAMKTLGNEFFKIPKDLIN